MLSPWALALGFRAVLRAQVVEPAASSRCNRIVRLPLAVLLLASVAVLGTATLAAAKEDARARLTKPLPLGARPGSTISVEWTVRVPDGDGSSRPFGAGSMFVRLLSKTGADSTVGFADTDRRGFNRTRVEVPRGGIGGVRVGLRGWNSRGVADLRLLFPLENDPFRSPGGIRCDVATLKPLLAAFVSAYNRGDYRRLDRLFSRGRFVWYFAIGPDRDLRDAKQSRETLIPYFRARHRSGDRLEINSFRFNGYERERDRSHFQFEGRRRADDVRRGEWRPMTGKGGLDCSRPPVRIALLLVGGTP
jgi:hypothetical protein